MKILVHEIDENGVFKNDVIVHFWEIDKLSNIVTTHVPEGLHSPKWTGKEWVENRTQNNNETVNNTVVIPSIEERLKSVEDAVMTLLESSIPMGEE